MNAGDPITVNAGFSALKHLNCGRSLRTILAPCFNAGPSESAHQTLPDPNQVRLQIEEREQELRERGGGSSENRDDFVQLARWYAELQQHEKALSYLSRAMRLIGRPDSEILNLEGIYAGELEDLRSAERAYR